MAAATTFIVLDSIKICKDQNQIKADQNQINEYTQDATLLKGFSSTFKSLSCEAIDIQSNLQQITDEWTALENSIQFVIDDLLKAKSGMSSEDWNNVKNVFEVASEDWDKMIKLLGPLNIQINANDAQIKLGMMENEVKEAMENGKQMSFLEFIRQVS